MKLIITDTIAEHHAVNVFRAFQYAESTGSPLDLHYTVVWAYRKDYPRKESIEEQCNFVRARSDRIKRGFTDFCLHHQLPNHLVYVHENDEIGRYQNLLKLVHTHIAVHVPEHLRRQLLPLMQRWAAEGSPIIPGRMVHPADHPTWQTICAYQLKGADLSAQLHQADGQVLLLRDVLRHLAPAVATDPAKWVQGEIHGKRVGMSRQLDAAARDAAGFVPPVVAVPDDQRWTADQLRYHRFLRQLADEDRWSTGRDDELEDAA